MKDESFWKSKLFWEADISGTIALCDSPCFIYAYKFIGGILSHRGESTIPATSCVRCSLRRWFAPAPTRNSLHISWYRIASWILLMPTKVLLLRHASAGAASRCVTTRALLIVAVRCLSPYAKFGMHLSSLAQFGMHLSPLAQLLTCSAKKPAFVFTPFTKTMPLQWNSFHTWQENSFPCCSLPSQKASLRVKF